MKILYLMHVDWNWIKQRPHFVAEYLAKNGCEVEVYYNKYGHKDLVDNKWNFSTLQPLPKLRGARFSIIQFLNRILYYFYIKKLQKQTSYDYIFLTHPSMFTKSMIGKIIYDCMDDNAAFNVSVREKKEILLKERILVGKANIVLFSSQYLCDTVLRRNALLPKKYAVVNNAIELPTIDIKGNYGRKNADTLVLAYIGTISDWFDFDMLLQVQKKYQEKKLLFNLYGPVDVKNKRIDGSFNLMGAISHDKIFDVMAASDILIMPFVVTELIKSVNPVKLYEYIYSGKPIICVRYGESEKFNEQVYLYDSENADSFIAQLNLIEKNDFKGKLSEKEALEYVSANTWQARVGTILKLLKE
ncbi:MAG: glycosyltransferase [Treponema sp.]|nr:glycosyltransferase [Treponema sp.]